jgi:membrane-associated progesterone receptor component
MPMREFSAEELARHDGTDPSVPLLLCVNGIVYDVSRGRDFYGPGAAQWCSGCCGRVRETLR